jgi:hypothetical protein
MSARLWCGDVLTFLLVLFVLSTSSSSGWALHLPSAASEYLPFATSLQNKAVLSSGGRKALGAAAALLFTAGDCSLLFTAAPLHPGPKLRKCFRSVRSPILILSEPLLKAFHASSYHPRPRYNSILLYVGIRRGEEHSAGALSRLFGPDLCQMSLLLQKFSCS